MVRILFEDDPAAVLCGFYDIELVLRILVPPCLDRYTHVDIAVGCFLVSSQKRGSVIIPAGKRSGMAIVAVIGKGVPLVGISQISARRFTRLVGEKNLKALLFEVRQIACVDREG